MVTAEHARPCCQRRGVRVTTVEPRPYKSTLVSCGNMRDCYATAVRKACWLWCAGFSHGDYHLDEAKSEVVEGPGRTSFRATIINPYCKSWSVGCPFLHAQAILHGRPAHCSTAHLCNV